MLACNNKLNVVLVDELAPPSWYIDEILLNQVVLYSVVTNACNY